MRNKTLFLSLMMLLITGTAGLNIFWLDHYIPRSRKSLPPVHRNSGQVTDVFNEKEGWGFVRSRDGKTPEITAHQSDLVRKYGALYLGDVRKKQVTLTFDMGYEKEGLTPRILEALKKNNIKASFFVTTHWIEKNPELAKQLLREGHILGNHTVKHKSLPTLSDDEVKKEIRGWEDIARQVADYQIKYKYMRPPMGEYSERTLMLTRDMGYKTAFWSVAIRDWLPMGGPGEAVKGIVGQLHNGAVVLLHGNSEDVVGGLEDIIAEIRAKGYKIVPIYEI
ncbi:MAG: polysaccharide deacetylase family protein [Firmicutes bacterium]|nr:polysaccharide deacetylase family protein [Bacillota bacterium]